MLVHKRQLVFLALERVGRLNDIGEIVSSFVTRWLPAGGLSSRPETFWSKGDLLPDLGFLIVFTDSFLFYRRICHLFVAIRPVPCSDFATR